MSTAAAALVLVTASATAATLMSVASVAVLILTAATTAVTTTVFWTRAVFRRWRAMSFGRTATMFWRAVTTYKREKNTQSFNSELQSRRVRNIQNSRLLLWWRLLLPPPPFFDDEYSSLNRSPLAMSSFMASCSRSLQSLPDSSSVSNSASVDNTRRKIFYQPRLLFKRNTTISQHTRLHRYRHLRTLLNTLNHRPIHLRHFRCRKAAK